MEIINFFGMAGLCSVIEKELKESIIWKIFDNILIIISSVKSS